jgi:putative transport protein
MIEMVRSFLESSPLMALFLAIATGYAIGQITIAGVSFGAQRSSPAPWSS